MVIASNKHADVCGLVIGARCGRRVDNKENEHVPVEEEVPSFVRELVEEEARLQKVHTSEGPLTTVCVVMHPDRHSRSPWRSAWQEKEEAARLARLKLNLRVFYKGKELRVR